jgi:hypothetical protein
MQLVQPRTPFLVTAIDGMLVWTEKPSQNDCLLMKCGSGRFMCGRKGKFGFNLQGVCDAQGRFIEAWITNPASSSDYISFIRSSLFTKLNQPGFLVEGLALFGDNAYVSTDYMVTPYSNVREGPKDDFNFFQSQLRINVECSFGMLVQRWSILRRPLPSMMGVKKQICLVMALCKLHNFCMTGDDDDRRMPRLSPNDELSIMVNGGVELNYDVIDSVPVELLHGGDHFDDVEATDLPPGPAGRSKVRQRLLAHVERKDLHRTVVSKRRLYG